MSLKNGWAIGGISLILLVGMMYHAWKTQSENQRLLMINSIYKAELRIIKGEVQEYVSKPTYEQGVKDTLIRVGGPQTPSSYYDGWDDAMKVAGDGSYATGYHAAIQQFGYQKPANIAHWMAPKPEEVAQDKEENSTQTSFSEE